MMFRDHVPSEGRKRKTRVTTSKQKETSVNLLTQMLIISHHQRLQKYEKEVDHWDQRMFLKHKCLGTVYGSSHSFHINLEI